MAYGGSGGEEIGVEGRENGGEETGKKDPNNANGEDRLRECGKGVEGIGKGGKEGASIEAAGRCKNVEKKPTDNADEQAVAGDLRGFGGKTALKKVGLGKG